MGHQHPAFHMQYFPDTNAYVSKPLKSITTVLVYWFSPPDFSLVNSSFILFMKMVSRLLYVFIGCLQIANLTTSFIGSTP